MRLITLTLISVFVTMTLVSPGSAQVSSANSISFQGTLNGDTGQPLSNGSYNLAFQLWDHPTATAAINKIGSAILVANVAVSGGIASTAIPVDPSSFNGQTRYLGISINNGTELSPRVLITSVPYAINAQSLGNGSLVTGTNGNVGLGTSNPQSQFHMIGNSANGVPPFRLDQTGDGLDYGLMITEPNGPASARICLAANTLTVAAGNGTTSAFRVQQRGDGVDAGIQLDSPSGQSSARIYMVGNQLSIGTSVLGSGVVVDSTGVVQVHVLRIIGGADLAEHLSVTADKSNDKFKVEPGMVVSIDPTGNRKFKLSDEPYDRKRVGIISGGNGVKPGLVLRDEGNPQADGEQPIALTGQVWCQADASFGSITPGDLLTTSATAGRAMKVTDDTKARFAVLGQALTGLKDGRGWVQVLVGKQ